MRNFCISEKVSQYIGKYNPAIAVLAPSLDTIPSKQGSAIYCLIEDIAYNSAYPVIVFSKFEKGLPESKISDRIIYYTRPFKKTFFQQLAGYRLRKRIYGISATEDIRYAKDVYKFCLGNNIKCLVLEDSNSLLAGLPRYPAIKIILHQHANSLVNLKDRFFYSFTRKLSKIVFVSDINRARTCAKFPGLKTPAVTIYNGIDPSVFSPSTIEETSALKKAHHIPDGAIVLLFAGRIHPHKGVKELLGSLKFIEDYNVIVLLAGDLKTAYDYDANFENQIKGLISEKVILLGPVLQAKIPEYYSVSDFVIIPSTGSEGLPKVATEALLMGKPVIASDRGGMIELVKEGENGVTIEEPVCPENIAKAINKAIDNKEALANNAAGSISINRERFSSVMMAKQFDAIFQDLLSL